MTRDLVASRLALSLGLFGALGAFFPANAGAAGQCGPVGSTSLLAEMPAEDAVFPPTGPTYPEGVAVLGNRVIVSGPATFGTAGNGSPSQLTVFDRHSGELLQEVPLVGENLDFEHALSELDAWHNYVYAPSTQLGVLRWKFTGNQVPEQESVSTPFCSVTGFFPCHAESDLCPADVRPGLPPLPNGISVDDGGDVYVADALQGIVWREPAATADLPAEPEVVFCSAALQGSGTEGLSLFGANGIAVVGDDLYVSVTFGPPGAFGAPTSVIYRMPKVAPTPADLEAVYTFEAAEVAPGIVVPPLADGIRVQPRSGHLFVVLAGHNQVAELDLGSTPAVEVARYSRLDPDHPFLNPSTIAFSPDGHSGYVSNHAITCCLPGDPSPTCVCTNAQDYFGVIEVCLP